MSDKIKIEKVEIKIGGNTLSLTIEQALELRDILNETFPKQVPVVTHVQLDQGPFYPAPVYIERLPSFPRPHWEIWCGGNAIGASSGMPLGQTLCLAAVN